MIDLHAARDILVQAIYFTGAGELSNRVKSTAKEPLPVYGRAFRHAYLRKALFCFGGCLQEGLSLGGNPVSRLGRPEADRNHSRGVEQR
jgi:hypothetical protein